jgi:hypothetical protein
MKSLATARAFIVSKLQTLQMFELRNSAKVEDADHARHAVSSQFDGTSHEGRK